MGRSLGTLEFLNVLFHCPGPVGFCSGDRSWRGTGDESRRAREGGCWLSKSAALATVHGLKQSLAGGARQVGRLPSLCLSCPPPQPPAAAPPRPELQSPLSPGPAQPGCSGLGRHEARTACKAYIWKKNASLSKKRTGDTELERKKE